MKVRLFASLEIPSNILEKLIDLRISISNSLDFKWEQKNKLHLTIKFFGDVDLDKIDDIKSEIIDISRNYRNIQSSFTKFGIFFKHGKPSVLWAGLEANDYLIALYNELNDKMEKLGFELSKFPFKPHVTLCRLRGNESNLIIDKFNKTRININKFNFNSIKLIQSELTRAGSLYTVLSKIEI